MMRVVCILLILSVIFFYIELKLFVEGYEKVLWINEFFTKARVKVEGK
jgi:hypothetical protein